MGLEDELFRTQEAIKTVEDILEGDHPMLSEQVWHGDHSWTRREGLITTAGILQRHFSRLGRQIPDSWAPAGHE